MSADDRPIPNGACSAKFLRPSQLPKRPGREQVAAVCYRISGQAIEFLLVQTRKGRRTFPKGGVEPRLSHAQAAALEAFEEAGVHGRMEEESFARYTLRGRGDLGRAAEREITVRAHLCQVSWLGPSQEAGRNPTWFSPEKAKERLRRGRTSDDSAELARVVDRAVARIRRLQHLACAPADALTKVQLEALPEPGIHTRVEAALFAYIRRCGDSRRSAAVEFNGSAQRSKVLQLGPPQKRNPRLLEAHAGLRTDLGVTETKALGTGRKNRRS